MDDRDLPWLAIIAAGLAALSAPVPLQVLYLVLALPSLWALRQSR